MTCPTNAGQSYALYLPSAYNPSKRWPIIYFFDPGGRGRRPVELYRDLAEKYGFVIAGSNNSRNFAGDESKAVNSIWQETHSRLSLDEHRVYTSGFSGGARVAGAMAVGCPQCQIAGVIAHGAGYPSNAAQTNNKLLYFFAIGDQDFNWPEVMAIRREREDKGLPYRVYVFSGPHQWAPAAVMEDAITWLMLKSMQAGDLPRDDGFVDEMFRKLQAEAADAAKRNDVIAQVGAYRSMISDFSGFKDVSEADKSLLLLKKSAALKTALKSEQDQIKEQSILENDISSKIHAYIDAPGEDSNELRAEIVEAMSRLADQAAHSKNDVKRLVSKRAADGLWVAGIETGQQQFESRHLDKAEACFQMMSQLRDDPWPVLLLAETHAAQGNRKQAIKDLREAVKRGLKDPDVIESDAKLQSLKSHAEFQKILDGLKSY